MSLLGTCMLSLCMAQGEYVWRLHLPCSIWIISASYHQSEKYIENNNIIVVFRDLNQNRSLLYCRINTCTLLIGNSFKIQNIFLFTYFGKRISTFFFPPQYLLNLCSATLHTDKGFGQSNKDLLIFTEFLSSSSWVRKSNNGVRTFLTDEDTTYISL